MCAPLCPCTSSRRPRYVSPSPHRSFSHALRRDVVHFVPRRVKDRSSSHANPGREDSSHCQEDVRASTRRLRCVLKIFMSLAYLTVRRQLPSTQPITALPCRHRDPFQLIAWSVSVDVPSAFQPIHAVVLTLVGVASECPVLSRSPASVHQVAAGVDSVYSKALFRLEKCTIDPLAEFWLT